MTTARSAQDATATTTLDWDALVGQKVHMLMWGARLTQTELAPRLDLTQTGLSKKLRGERGWSVDELVRVAGALGTTVAYLVGETDDPGTPRPNRPLSDYSAAHSGRVTSIADAPSRRIVRTIETEGVGA